jgi:hypothetical protein
VLCGLTLPSLHISSKSIKKFCLPGTQENIILQSSPGQHVDHTCPLPQDVVALLCRPWVSPRQKLLIRQDFFLMKIEASMRVSAREEGEMMSPANTRKDRFCCKRIALQNLGVIAWKHDPHDITMSVLLVCIQCSSKLNIKVRENIDGDFKYHYFVRCDFCNKTSEPHGIMNFSNYFVEWMSTRNHAKDKIVSC